MMMLRATLVWATLLLACLSAYVAFTASTYALNHGQRNAKDHYRWPWLYGSTYTITQGQNGSFSHFDYSPIDGHYVGLGHAVDFAYTAHNPVAAATDGIAYCENQDSNEMGYVVKVAHSPDADLYGHANDCALGWGNSVPVAQGRQISYTGTRADSSNSVQDHVHFQRNSSTSGGTGTPQIAVAFTMEGFSSLNDSVENGNTATSDNLSAGYSSAFTWEQAIHDKYLAKGGVDVVGSSAWITAWEPGNAGSGGCWPGLTSGWYSCTVNGRSGKVQTFKGVGSGSGEHAILKGSALSAAFMSRGLLGGFTDPFDASGNDGLWWMGYPISDSYSIGGGRYEMDFQNGYAYYTPYPSCLAQFYAGGVLKLSTSAYCD